MLNPLHLPTVEEGFPAEAIRKKKKHALFHLSTIVRFDLAGGKFLIANYRRRFGQLQKKIFGRKKGNILIDKFVDKVIWAKAKEIGGIKARTGDPNERGFKI